jgi:hypothetical protein
MGKPGTTSSERSVVHLSCQLFSNILIHGGGGVTHRFVATRTQTFITWINSILQERNMEVISLERDFSDGVKLINLIEILSGWPPLL